ncbi:MAG TPA: hypothetical protein VGM06_13680 [Polyangiaceae bacterium]
MHTTRGALLVAVALLAAGAAMGCAQLLGDFDESSGGAPGDGSIEAEGGEQVHDAAGEADAPFDAAADTGDARVDRDAGLADGGDAARGPDATLDAGPVDARADGDAGVGVGVDAAPIDAGTDAPDAPPGCGATTCANGCCNNGQCVTAETSSACGTGGVACQSCPSQAACTSGICLGCAGPVLLAEPSGTAGDGFASSVAIDGANMIVGSPNNGGSGVAWWFTGSGTTWTSQASIVEPTAQPAGTNFASLVALSGATAMVLASPNGTGADDIFLEQGGAWFPSGSLAMPSDSFGAPAFALSGGTVVFGEEASATVYTNAGTSWPLQATLAPSDFVPSTATDLFFGFPVAIDGDTVVVGAEPYDTSFQPAHWGYVFARSGTTWTQQGKLVPDGLADNGGPHFNFQLAVQGDTAVIATSFGAYVFGRSGTTWTQTQLIPVPPNEGAFGTSVALDGNDLAIAAATYNGGTSSVYFYGRAPGGAWIAGPVLQNASAPIFFANSVAMRAGTLAVGGATDSSGMTGALFLYACSP